MKPLIIFIGYGLSLIVGFNSFRGTAQANLSDSICLKTEKNVVPQKDKAAFLLIDKETMTLSVIDYNGDDIYRFLIACGANYGNKMRQGDKKTPEGIFRIKEINNSQSWTHDFGDGKGDVKGAYGPWFIRIDVPGHSGIGIHGTHDDGSIGTRVTEGCIRLHNGDVEKLKSVIFTGMVVVILPSRNDILANN